MRNDSTSNIRVTCVGGGVVSFEVSTVVVQGYGTCVALIISSGMPLKNGDV